jgi:hypothetical protein
LAWKPVFALGASGHYAIGHFLTSLFLEASKVDAHLFGQRWDQIVRFALSNNEWLESTPWYYVQRLTRQALGFGSQLTLDAISSFKDVVAAMKPLYEQWAVQNLAVEEDNIAAFCVFLTSVTGHSLRLEALIWLRDALENQDRASWRRSGTSNALVELLSVVLAEDSAQLPSFPKAREALVWLIAHLVGRQVPTALALEEQARRVLGK